jgi:hypothetical protein
MIARPFRGNGFQPLLQLKTVKAIGRCNATKCHYILACENGDYIHFLIMCDSQVSRKKDEMWRFNLTIAKGNGSRDNCSSLFLMIGVNLQIGKSIDTFFWTQIANVCHHCGQEGVGWNIPLTPGNISALRWSRCQLHLLPDETENWKNATQSGSAISPVSPGFQADVIGLRLGGSFWIYPPTLARWHIVLPSGAHHVSTRCDKHAQVFWFRRSIHSRFLYHYLVNIWH